MNKIYIKISALLSLAAFTSIQSRTIETPIPFTYGLPMPHYPVNYIRDTEEAAYDDCWHFDFQAFGGAYYRDANNAYGNCDGTSKVPLAQLIFGQSSFTIAQAFPGASIGGLLPNNPFVSISTITPSLGWSEHGAVFIADVSTTFDWCCTNYRVGLRGRLPVRDIEVYNVCGLQSLEGDITDISAVYRKREEVIPAAGADCPQETNTVFAARLDFLSAIEAVVGQPMVNYANATQAGHMTIDEQIVDISDAAFASAAPADANIPPVAAIYRADGSVPLNDVWGQYKTAITGSIAANGSGLIEDQRGRFNSAVDYSGAYPVLSSNVPAQQTLWIVPTLQANNIGGNCNQLTQAALNIEAAIDLAITNINTSTLDFILAQGLNFCDGRTKGLGDFQLELYLGRDWGCDNQWWTDFVFGAKFPTGDKLCNCLNVLQQPVGNDGHFELYGALYAGWDAYDWMKFMLDFTAGGALSESERVAAPFTGATVKNIGPCINADIHWWYLVGHFDVSFFASDCCGFDIGYEIYHKGCDQISLCATTATDFLGRINQPLDASVLSSQTSRTSHKIRAGFFTTVGVCEIFGGWSQVVAGKNIPRETDWYISMAVNF